MKRYLPLILILFFICVKFDLTEVKGADCSDPSKLFSSSYNVSFSFDSKGTASVNQKVSLKNLVDGCFASQYALALNSANVKNISASDTLGKIAISVKKSTGKSTISANLNDKVIGKNKSVNFEIKYQVVGLAHRRGLTWEIIVPSINTSEKINQYLLTVNTPKSFGSLVSVEPPYDTYSSVGKTNTIAYKKNSALDKTVLANYGTTQQINFELKIPVKSKNLLPQQIQVAVPVENSKQNSLYTYISPSDGKFKNGQNDNLMVYFDDRTVSRNIISLKGFTQIVINKKQITKDSTQKYLEGGKFIQVQSKSIQQKANELKNINNIYQFVGDYLTYDTKSYEKGYDNRDTVSQIMAGKKEQTNQGFVDLFAAISKAAGIPTRLVYGLVVSEEKSFKPIFVGAPFNTKNFGVWLEVYDDSSRSWISIDPTLGEILGINYIQSTFFDRIALFQSVSGEDTQILEKISSSNESVGVSYINQKTNIENKVLIDTEVDQVLAGFPVNLKVSIQNQKGTNIASSKLKINSSGVDLIGNETVFLGDIKPFEKKVVTIKLRSGNLLASEKGEVSVAFSGSNSFGKVVESTTQKVSIRGFFTLGVQQILLLFILVLLLFGILYPKYSRSKSIKAS